jgi:hypothetical protein
MSDQEIRVPVMRRLMEQAMTDEAFRQIARSDLDQALLDNAYDLNDRERTLVFRFRDALSEAGIDVLLDSPAGANVKKLMDDVGIDGLEDMFLSTPRGNMPSS